MRGKHPLNLEREIELWENGYRLIGCLDEVGRGPFAGPVVAAAVVMPQYVHIVGLTDSKAIKRREKRSELAAIIKQTALCHGIGVVDVDELDRIDNINTSVRLAMKRALASMSIVPNYLLIDEIKGEIDIEIPQTFITKGDLHCHGISAASVIAKVYRDNYMKQLDEVYGNVYGWATNAGYQTAKHIEACRIHGLTPHHRKSWKKTMKLLMD